MTQIQLRGGHVTHDPRLGRIPHFDQRDQLVWLAGLCEGEAYFADHVSDIATSSCALRLAMTDEDVIRRAHQFARVGNVTGPYIKEGNRKPIWQWAVYDRRDLLPLLKSLRPLMGSRRSKVIDKMISQLENGDGRCKPMRHGTVAGYKRHLRNDEQACADCKRANAVRSANLRSRS